MKRVCVFSILLVLISSFVFGKSLKVAIGLVDVVPLILFHPYMDTFVASEGLFLNVDPDKFNNMSIQERSKLIKKLSSEWRNKAGVAKIKLGELRKKIDDLFQKKNDVLVMYNRKVKAIKGMSQKLSKKELQQKLNEAEYYLWKENKKIMGEIDHYKKMYEKVKSEVVSTYYLEGERAIARINEIIGDIKEGIEAAAKRYNLAFVFNSSFSLNPQRMTDKEKKIWEEIMGLSYKKTVYEMFPYPQTDSSFFEPHTRNYYVDEYNDRYIYLKEYLKLFSTSSLLRSSVLYGGKDVTAYVLLYILKKHNLPKNKIKDILEAFRQVYIKSN